MAALAVSGFRHASLSAAAAAAAAAAPKAGAAFRKALAGISHSFAGVGPSFHVTPAWPMLVYFEQLAARETSEEEEGGGEAGASGGKGKDTATAQQQQQQQVPPLSASPQQPPLAPAAPATTPLPSSHAALLPHSLPPVLLGQSLHAFCLPYMSPSLDLPVGRPATPPLRVGQVYALKLVLVNLRPTPLPCLLLLFQVPQGAVALCPLLRPTGRERFSLGPFEKREFFALFYFPCPGQFTVFPAHLLRDSSSAQPTRGAAAGARTVSGRHSEVVAVAADCSTCVEVVSLEGHKQQQKRRQLALMDQLASTGSGGASASGGLALPGAAGGMWEPSSVNAAELWAAACRAGSDAALIDLLSSLPLSSLDLSLLLPRLRASHALFLSATSVLRER